MAELEFKHELSSRKERYSKNRIKLRLPNVSWYLCLSITGSLLWAHQWIAASLFFVLFLPLLLDKWIVKNPVTISILFFILKPLSMSFFTLLLIAMMFKNKLPESFAYYYILASVPVMSLILMWANRDQEEFLKKSKVALEFNNFLFLILSLGLVLYAYEQTNFKFLSPVVDLERVTKMGFQDRDVFNYLSNIFSFPFLVSTALCKWLLELIMYKKGM